jgi:hypothetical protein
MRTESVKSYSPNFGNIVFLKNIKANKSLMESISKVPAIKYFGKKYNANASLQVFSDVVNADKVTLGITLEHIRPSNKFISFVDFFRERKIFDYINYNSGKQTEKELVEALNKLDEKAFVKLYKSSL